MRRYLPSLTALKAFESAARLTSFSNAATELNVTQGAISRQIQVLEEFLHTKLFVRLTRRVELTEQGRNYLLEVQFALNSIENASARVSAQSRNSILTINVLPSVATFWLMPRLASFTRQYPEIDTRIITSIRAVDLLSGEADVAIRVGPFPGKRYGLHQPRIDLEMVTNWRGVHSEPLFLDVLVPIHATHLLGARAPLTSPRDLLQFPLIHTASRPHAWPDWLHAQGVNDLSGNEQIEYGHFFMSMEAAREGQGIAIVPNILMQGSGLNGLVTAFKSDIQSAGEYYLLTLGDRADEPPIANFRGWLQEQVRQV